MGGGHDTNTVNITYFARPTPVSCRMNCSYSFSIALEARKLFVSDIAETGKHSTVNLCLVIE